MVPVSYAYRNVMVRRRTTLMTAIGFTLVVAALIIMLAFLNGIQAACVVTGRPENVFVLNKGNLDEVLSQIDVITARQVENIPETLRDEEGRLLASRELYCVVTESDAETKDPILYQIRGIQRTAWQVHSQAKISEGRMFRPGAGEIVVGRGFAWEKKLKLGDVISIGGREWTVVGVFTAEGSTFETEIWGDLTELAGFFRRQAQYSSIVLKTADPIAAAAAVRRLNDSRTISVDAQLESEYYGRQAAQLDTIRTGALVVVVFMAIGAMFGVTNTMFAAVSQRIKDIAVMRLMGFERGEILLSFLFETLLIALIGGLIGGVLGYMVDGMSLSTSMGAKSIAFSFRVDSWSLIMAACLTLAIGFLGGLIPAYSAMRVSPLESLR